MVPQAEESAPLLEALRLRGYEGPTRLMGRLDVACLEALALGVVIGGHGKVQLAVQTQHLLDRLPAVQTVVCAGAAGSLTAAARWGDVVVGSCSIEHDYRLRFVSAPLPVHAADSSVVQQILALRAQLAGDYRLLYGPIASGDEDIVDLERARELHSETGAVCVAWEGAGGERAAAFSRRAFVELRVITDSCDSGAAADYHESMDAVMPHLADVLATWAGADRGLAGAST
ncbi:MAG: acyltransferase [Actinobacteria bacterium]|nr:acyltransferase [Actinomycetota bacterium]